MQDSDPRGTGLDIPAALDKHPIQNAPVTVLTKTREHLTPTGRVQNP